MLRRFFSKLVSRNFLKTDILEDILEYLNHVSFPLLFHEASPPVVDNEDETNEDEDKTDLTFSLPTGTPIADSSHDPDWCQASHSEN